MSLTGSIYRFCVLLNCPGTATCFHTEYIFRYATFWLCVLQPLITRFDIPLLDASVWNVDHVVESTESVICKVVAHGVGCWLPPRSCRALLQPCKSPVISSFGSGIFWWSVLTHLKKRERGLDSGFKGITERKNLRPHLLVVESRGVVVAARMRHTCPICGLLVVLLRFKQTRGSSEF